MDNSIIERMRYLLAYDADSGIFTWKVKRTNCVKVGTVAGYVNPVGYRSISINDKSYLAHRLAWLYIHGVWPKDRIDHVNGNRDDNRIANLRDVSASMNNQNQRKAHRHSITGFLGVNPERSKWRARIWFNGKKHHIGMFDTPELAHAAYLEAKRKVHAGCTI